MGAVCDKRLDDTLLSRKCTFRPQRRVDVLREEWICVAEACAEDDIIYTREDLQNERGLSVGW